MLRTLLIVVLLALPAWAQTPQQLADWCYGESTDEETVRGCDAEIASGRARNLADAYGSRGYAYNRLHQYDKALADHNMSIQLNPSVAMYYNNRGWTLNNLGRHQDALQDLDRALRLDSKLAAAHNNRGVSYRGLGQLDRAIQEYDQALRLKPGHELYLRNRAAAVKEKAGK
jgi:tetratricopeptide (TPR) repeat protein